MDTKVSATKANGLFAIHALITFILAVSFSLNGLAQNRRAIDGEMATCKITVNNKIYQPQLNQMGCFDRISNVSPSSMIPVEVYYPNSNSGEKIVVSVEDGGKLANGKTVQVLSLNNENKCFFTFYVSDQPGIYHISLYKGSDTKVVQIWVDEQPSAVTN